MTWWIVWASVMWGIWLHRNEIVFNNKNCDIQALLNAFRLRAWNWAKAHVKSFNPSLYARNLQPKEMLEQQG